MIYPPKNFRFYKVIPLIKMNLFPCFEIYLLPFMLCKYRTHFLALNFLLFPKIAVIPSAPIHIINILFLIC